MQVCIVVMRATCNKVCCFIGDHLVQEVTYPYLLSRSFIANCGLSASAVTFHRPAFFTHYLTACIAYPVKKRSLQHHMEYKLYELCIEHSYKIRRRHPFPQNQENNGPIKAHLHNWLFFSRLVSGGQHRLVAVTINVLIIIIRILQIQMLKSTAET